MDSSKRRRSPRPASRKKVDTLEAKLESLLRREDPAEKEYSAVSAPAKPIRIPRAIQLLPYQERWLWDATALKLAVKARQTGYSFAATLRAVHACLNRKTTWIFLSKGERQSRLLMEKAAEHVRSFGVAARSLESTYFEGTLSKQLEIRFPNGSVIYGLPANPDTARGYTGNVTLDEFAFHADAAKIYTALFPTITRGYGIEVISTPNGTQGKFYELAKAAGLAEPGLGTGDSGFGMNESSAARIPHPEPRTPQWSAHRTDIYEAAGQGLRIDIPLLRAACEDEISWQQEYCCGFVSTAENFFSPELLAASLSAEASPSTPLLLLASAAGRDWGPGTRESGLAKAGLANPVPRGPHPEFFVGIDVGRRHDRTVFWVDELRNPSPLRLREHPLPMGEGPGMRGQGRRSIARLVKAFDRTPFSAQLAYARELLGLRGGDGRPLISRVAIDATGIGLMLAESLAQEFGPRVEPVTFTAAVKEDLAFRTRRRMEEGLTLLPDTREVRAAFSAVKKFVTPAGNFRFDAARTDAGHADEFWAKALADYAADLRPAGGRASDGYLAGGAPMIDLRAFTLADDGFAILDF